MAGNDGSFDIKTGEAMSVAAQFDTQRAHLEDLLRDVQAKRDALLADSFIGQTASAYGVSNVNWSQQQGELNVALNNLRTTLVNNVGSYEDNDSQGAKFFTL